MLRVAQVPTPLRALPSSPSQLLLSGRHGTELNGLHRRQDRRHKRSCIGTLNSPKSPSSTGDEAQCQDGEKDTDGCDLDYKDGVGDSVVQSDGKDEKQEEGNAREEEEEEEEEQD
ncbi:hypothetical protein TcWFU_006016 [Taenia crassiceps]|uniref:Uncharacterized protein n=1 Tax=Taenia crassiceps TaxID=6207 RepID=A0ABR4QB80_9CEST